MSTPADVVTPGTIGFQLLAFVQGMIFNPARKEGLRFRQGDARNLHISLAPEEDEEGFGDYRLTYRLRAEFPASQRQIDFVRALITKRYVPEQSIVDLPLVIRGETKIDASGVISDGFHFRLELAPAEIQTLLKEAETYLEDTAARFLRLLQWRQAISTSQSPLEFNSLLWRTDPGYYHATPRPLSASGLSQTRRGDLTWGSHENENLSKLWLGDAEEPLAHELIREAGIIRLQSERSAVLIAVSAAETGLKAHLSQIVPKLSWLMEKAPSPPIYTMLRDYVPRIHEGSGVDLSFWPALQPTLSAVRKAVEARNSLAHTGQMDTTIDVEEVIAQIRDLLYVLDVLAGHEWAKTTVRPELAATLNWPRPTDGALWLQWSQPDDDALRKLLASSPTQRNLEGSSRRR
ncbi:hypothetical protein [Brevundimonas sp.]|uniref:hypothetical protein n=1 Tax=Brevundimonas sp. TaxID=1871086 RepID=UPI00289B8A15|nr:hypothetical protein [Brevundimonas sp.]